MKYTVIHAIKVIDLQKSVTAYNRSLFEHEDNDEVEGETGWEDRVVDWKGCGEVKGSAGKSLTT